VSTILQWRARRLVVVALLTLPIACAGTLAGAAGVPIGRITVVGSRAERSLNGRDWSEIADGALLRTGDRIRSDDRTLARIDVGWVSLVLSPSSEIEIPPSKVLSFRLERGRLQQTSEGEDIVTMRTSECLVRGRGHIVVRREAQTTAISVRVGRFRIDAAGAVASLDPGFGLLIRRGQPPSAPRPLLPAPDGLVPGPDPLYVERNEPVHLEWHSSAQLHEVELLAVGTETLVQQTNVGTSPAALTVPWPGTYRWRVVARDADGLESLPSRSGLLCVPGW
jgi:hypothetical protein